MANRAGGLVALAATGLLAACSIGDGGASRGSVLRARLNGDILSSQPGTRRDLNTDAVLLHVVEGLVASRDDGSVAPMLASGWTVSPDGTRYRFRLRDGVRFHNGAPLTAAEVRWSLDRYLAPDTHWRCRGDLTGGIARIVAVAAPDPMSVEIALDRPAPLFLKTLARADCGGTGILHPASVGRDGAWRAPVGTGPFAWSEWRRNEFVELRRFAGYAALPGAPDGNVGGKHALVDRVRFLVIPDGSSASAALLRGSLDVLDGLSASEFTQMRDQPGISVAPSNSVDMFGLLFQTRDPALADPRLRRAIALSLDVAALTRVVTHGTGTPDSSPIAAASPYFGPVQRPLIRRDLARARALARAAGYRGEPITLITSQAPPEAFDMAIVVQAMAREAGINFQVLTLDWATHFARYASGDYQAMIFGYSPRLDPALMIGAFTGSKADDPRKIWDSPRARALLQASIEAEEPAMRQRIFDDIDRLFRAEAPGVVLLNTGRITAVRDGVAGYRPWPAQLQRMWNVRAGGPG